MLYFALILFNLLERRKKTLNIIQKVKTLYTKQYNFNKESGLDILV